MKKTICLFFIIFVFLCAGMVSADVNNSMTFLKNIKWLGHDTFMIMGDGLIYTDPFKLKDKDIIRKADIILITHEHRDHCSPEDVKKIQGSNTTIITTPSCAAKLSGNIKKVKPGDSFSVGNIHIEAVPSYDIDKKYHKRENNDVGYIFTVKGLRLYFAGDTDLIPEMKAFKNINIAFLPVSGTYVMTAEEAVKAALDIKPDVAIPMHFGTIIGTRTDSEKFAEGLRGRVEVVILTEE